MGIFTWLKARRRRQLLAEPLPTSWRPYFDTVGYFQFLDAGQQTTLIDKARVFISEKTWEGCRGQEITDEIQVTVASMACLLILGMDDFYFDNVHTILVYPEGFRREESRAVGGNFVVEGEVPLIGEAHYRGPVILAWDQVHENARQPGTGSNLVLHEFAHQLDMLNGEADGMPWLPPEQIQRWQQVMNKEFRKLERHVDQGRRTLLDPYGATDPAEFFAVATECFFEWPRQAELELPELYALLRDFYRQHPAAWPWQ